MLYDEAALAVQCQDKNVAAVAKITFTSPEMRTELSPEELEGKAYDPLPKQYGSDSNEDATLWTGENTLMLRPCVCVYVRIFVCPPLDGASL